MINNLKLKIINIYNSKRIFFNTFYISILIIILFTLFFSKGKRNNNISKISTPNPSTSTVKTFQEEGQNKYLTRKKDESFYINQIITNNDIVTGFSWKGDKNIYSTKNGIFEAGTNNPIILTSINEVKWSNSFKALVKVNGSWKIFDYNNKTLIDISVNLTNPVIDNYSKRIADFVGNKAFIYNTDNFSFKEIKFDEPIQKIFFVDNSDSIIVSTNYAAKSYIYDINKEFTISKKFGSDDDYKLTSVSTDGKLFALILNNKMIISDFDKILISDTFLDKSILNVGFRNSKDFVIIEKYKDSLGRVLDNIYMSNISNKRFKISDSKALINRINLEIPMIFNGSRVIVTFGENKGKTWILSLEPNLYPTYSENGELVFSNIKPESH